MISHSAEETFRWGVELGALLAPFDVILLNGQLGAGKTHFVRGVAHGAGVPDGIVSSPTFSIIAQYSGRLPIYHVDLYRLENKDALYATGFFDCLEEPAAMLVEWADKFPGQISSESLSIELFHQTENARELSAQSTGKRPSELLAQWMSKIGMNTNQ